MRKKAKKPQPTNRQEWKEDIENEIITLQDEIDIAFEGMEVNESVKAMIENAISEFKYRANLVIDGFKVDTDIAFAEKDLFENMLEKVYYNEHPANDYEVERMRDIVEDNIGGQFVEAKTMAEQIKLDEFIESLRENPYQLKMIA